MPLPADRFSVVSLERGVSFDYKVTVTIIRLDVEPDEGALVRGAVGDLRQGREEGWASREHTSRRTGDNEDISGAVAAMSRALGRLGGEIAEEIRAHAHYRAAGRLSCLITSRRPFLPAWSGSQAIGSCLSPRPEKGQKAKGDNKRTGNPVDPLYAAKVEFVPEHADTRA